jgi:hypothetical protein
MTLWERVGDRLQRHARAIALAGDHRLDVLVAVAVGQIQQAVGGAE